MRLSTLINTGMTIIVLCVGAIGGRVVVLEASRHARAENGVTAARLAALTLQAASRTSFERGPTNGALGSEAPLSLERREPLAAYRAATDAAFDAISQELRAADARWADAIPSELAATRRHLAQVRNEIDDLVAQPLASRTDAGINRAVAGLVAIIPELSPGLNLMEAALAQADPSLTGLITAARAATEMRDYAGQLGSALTAAVAGRRPLTAAENARLDRATGHLEALNEQFRLSYAKLGSNSEIDRALAEIDAHFFGTGLGLVRQLADSGRTTGQFSMSTAEFAARFVPELQSVVALRDTTVTQFNQRINKVLDESTLSLALNGLAVALVLCVVGAIYWVMRVRVSLPLGAVSSALQRMAQGQLDATIASPARPDEIGAVIGALEIFRTALGDKARDEAARRELESRTNQLLSERAAELEQLYAELREEIVRRKSVQAALRSHRDNLERQVVARTAALATSEARLKDAIETIPEGFVLFDAEERLVMCNSVYREVYGFTEDVAKPGTSLEDLVRAATATGNYSGDPETLVRERLAQHRGVDRTGISFQPPRADGRWIEVRERRTREGGVVGLRIDVTEARRREAILGEQDKLAALGRLAGGVAHEINNLLQPALILPEVLREQLPAGDTESRELLGIVLDSIGKARDIIRNVLLFARNKDPALETVDLGVEIAATLKFVTELLPAGNVLRQHIDRSAGLAAVNKTELSQVLTNLVLNAVHASGDRASIDVTLAKARPSPGQAEALGLAAGAAYFTVAVADSGTGMDAATVARIFEPFFTTKPVGTGTGLGLSVVFGILQSWKGAIAVDSKLGEGTVFTLFIPVAEEGPPAGTAELIAA